MITESDSVTDVFSICFNATRGIDAVDSVIPKSARRQPFDHLNHRVVDDETKVIAGEQ